MYTKSGVYTTWRKLITQEMQEHGDSWDAVEACTLSNKELDRRFDADFGGTQGRAFTLWTKTRVYFPVQYDGAEWCGSVSRHPDGKPTHHMGSG